jgi:xylitol oxidase
VIGTDVPTTNWAHTITFRAAARHRPTSVAELQELVAASSRLRVLGSGHSFNELADTTGDLVSVAGLPDIADIDSAHSTVRVSAGTRYGELAEQLHRAGFGLPNLASLPHISIAGACATGTHGSGSTNGGLGTSVSAVEFVGGSGELVRLSRADNPSRFPGAVVALGCLGVLTSLTLDLVPTFDVAQYVFEGLPGEALIEHFEAIFASAYSVSVFTDWVTPGFRVWAKVRAGADDPSPWFAALGASAADGPRNPVPGVPADNCTEQGGVPGPWYDRLPHFRLDFTPSFGDELQSEALLARSDGPAALAAIAALRHQIAPVLLTAEIRTIAADDLWLSPTHGRDSVAFHFTWKKEPDAVRPVVGAIEAALAPFNARAHWGKVSTIDPAVTRAQYEKLPDFRALAAEHDPSGKFRNEFVDRYLA